MAEEPKTDTETARFLAWLRPPDAAFPGVALTAIKVAGGTTTDTHYDAKVGAGWIAAFDGRQNCYYMVNPPLGKLTKKASKPEVAAVALLHVDIDPAKDADWQAERERILASLEGYQPRPSAVIDSGNGYQALWRLLDPVPIGGADDWDRLEAYNRQLALDLRGDSTHDVSRILRLPGLTNIPDEKKRARGRVERPTATVWLDDSAYTLDDFTPASANNPKARPTSPSAVTLPSDIPAADLDALPAAVTPRTRMLIVQGDDPDDATKYGSKSEVMWAVTCELVRAGCPDEQIASVLLDPDLGVSDHPRRQKQSVQYVARQIERAREEVAKAQLDPSGRRVLDPAAPFATAKRLHGELFPHAIHTNDDWLDYDRGAYRAAEDATMRRAVWTALDAATVRKMKDDAVEFVPFKPGPGQVSGVLDALEAVAHQPAERMAPPVWLDGDGPPPGEIISCRNGLLHVPTGELLPPTPRFFTRNALDIDFDPGAAEPRAWLDFVEQTFPDPVAAELLREWFGYLLLPDTSQEKMLLMVGPPRSGKGTIQKVLTELVGQSNVCAPSIKSLGGGFGLQPMIGRQVAFLSDIRIGRGSDREAITETLLRITGQDDVTADRKHKEAWTGRLAVRFVISTNELPSLSDNSPALANRFVPLILETSHLGSEDPSLAAKLIAELPGVLNWAMAGWRSLRERGHFELPRVSVKAVTEIMELGSPTAQFVRDCCELGGDAYRVEKDRLFAAWQRWCGEKGERPIGESHFASNLRAATSQRVKSARLRENNGRVNVFIGIRLIPTGDDGLTSYQQRDLLEQDREEPDPY